MTYNYLLGSQNTIPNNNISTISFKIYIECLNLPNKKESYVITKPTSIRKPSSLQKDVQEVTEIRSVNMQVIPNIHTVWQIKQLDVQPLYVVART